MDTAACGESSVRAFVSDTVGFTQQHISPESWIGVCDESVHGDVVLCLQHAVTGALATASRSQQRLTPTMQQNEGGSAKIALVNNTTAVGSLARIPTILSALPD